MAGVYKTPGVYIEEISKFPPSVAQVETAIPAFIGYTQKAEEEAPDDLLGTAVRVTSMRQYEFLFGGPPSQTINVTLVDIPQADGSVLTTPRTATLGSSSPYKMYHSMQVYFANGGGPCYIISVGNYGDAVALNRMDATESAVNTGGLAIAKKVDEITLYAFPDAAVLTPADYYSLYESSLNECARLQDRFTIVDVKMNNTLAPSQASPHLPVTHIQNNANLGDNLKYGAAYYPWLKSVLTYNFGIDYGTGDVTFTNALGTLDGATWEDSEGDAIVNNLFVNSLKSTIGRLKIDLPPSPFVAGIYARVDSTRGVWKAPANVGVSAIVKPLVQISDEDQTNYNVDPNSGRSVNAIRSFTGKGTLIWGARTLAGNDNEWRYVSSRRFFNMAEESIKKATAQFVFEPNDANTWVKVRAMIENFLTLQWRAGALAGAKPEQAFFVRVGLGLTMTPIDVLEGRMIVEIGMAVVRPAEFIILQFSHKMQES
ncbi:MAG: phage tail sheath family protein [Saprospiraceae bacterium]